MSIVNFKKPVAIKGDAGTNGVSWTATTLPTAKYWTSVAWGASKFVAVAQGDDSSNTTDSYATSTDGITWTTPAAINGTSQNFIAKSVTVNSSGLFVVVGFDDTFNRPLFSTSSDGTTWTEPALMNGSSAVSTMNTVICNSSGRFVSLGKSNSNYLTTTYSDDGSTWQTPAAFSQPDIWKRIQAGTVPWP